jgi:hypothetical protein
MIKDINNDYLAKTAEFYNSSLYGNNGPITFNIICLGIMTLSNTVTNAKLSVPSSIQYSALFYIENASEIFPAHYTRKVAEKGFKMAFMTNILAMNDSCEIIVKK